MPVTGSIEPRIDRLSREHHRRSGPEEEGGGGWRERSRSPPPTSPQRRPSPREARRIEATRAHEPWVGGGGGGPLSDLSVEQMDRLEHLLSGSPPRAPSPGGGSMAKIEAWMVSMENRVAATESRLERELDQVAGRLEEVGRQQDEQTAAAQAVTAQLGTLSETVRQLGDQLSYHQLDQEGTVVATLGDVEEVATEVESRLRADFQQQNGAGLPQLAEQQMRAVSKLQASMQRQLEATQSSVRQMQDDLSMPAQLRIQAAAPPAEPPAPAEDEAAMRTSRRSMRLSLSSESDAEEAVAAAVSAATEGMETGGDAASASPREVIVMVEDSQNEGRITLAAIHTGHSVLQLKQVLAAKLKIPVEAQRLYFNDTLLEDTTAEGDEEGAVVPLGKKGISTGSIVRLERRVS